jgi:hypothetical protein
LTHSNPPGSIAQPRPAEQTALALFAILALLFSMMALLAAQPVQAVTNTAVLALSQDCSQDQKQIDLSGNQYLIQGDVHSNAGIHVSGNLNNATGAVRFNGSTDPLPTCLYEEPGSNNSGGFDSPTSSAPMADPAFAVPAQEDCTFDFSGRGDIDLNNEDGGPGE